MTGAPRSLKGSGLVTSVPLLELLRRRGRVRREDLERLYLTEPVDLKGLKSEWLAALGSADIFVLDRPPAEFLVSSIRQADDSLRAGWVT